MDTCKSPFIFLCLSVCACIVIAIRNDAYHLKFRKKRQNGYLYDKPSVSFDLPTRSTSAPTTIPVPPVTQMQMYYAYPVPATEKKVEQSSQPAGYSNTAAIASLSSGYNYENQNNGIQTGGNAVASPNTGSDGSLGYSYKIPDYSVNKPTVNQINDYTSMGATAPVTREGYQNNGLNDIGTSGGYNSQNNQRDSSAISGSFITGASSGGYNYEIQNTKQMSGNIVGASGYSSEKQNILVDTQMGINTANTGIGPNTGTSGGYIYGVQNTGSNQGVVNTANIGYSGGNTASIIAVAGTATNTENIGGYQSNVQSLGNQVVVGNTGNSGYSGTAAITNNNYNSISGYNYQKQSFGVKASPVSSIAASVGITSLDSSTGTAGYSYNGQNSGANQLTNSVNGNNAADSSGGYNYDSQHFEKTQSVTKTDDNAMSGYKYEKQNIEQPRTNTETIVSTAAPTYLPPMENFRPIEKPSESYLPPQTQETSVIVNNQTPTLTTNTPFVSEMYLSPAYLTPTKLDSVPEQKKNSEINMQTVVEYIPPSFKPSPPDRSYIMPNIQINQMVTEKPSKSQQNVQTNGHQYLPPTNSHSPTVNPPAFTYLPPV